MKPFVICLNFFTLAVLALAFATDPPLCPLFKGMLLSLMVVVPPADLVFFFRGKSGPFLRVFSTYIRLVFPDRPPGKHINH